MAKRGRPRKNAVAKDSKPKPARKVGRPRKNPSAKPKTKKIQKPSTTQGVKRKRGRPKKVRETQMMIHGKKQPQDTEPEPEKPEEVKLVGSSSLKIVTHPSKRKRRRRTAQVYSEDSEDSDQSDHNKSTETTSEFTAAQSSVENHPERPESVPKTRKSVAKTKSTSTTCTRSKTVTTAAKPTAKAIREIQAKLKDLDLKQEAMEENLAAIMKMMDRKFDMIFNQVNLVGLISLATMQEMQMPIHRLGIIRSLTAEYSEEITNEYCDVLIKGLNEAITLEKKKEERMLFKPNVADEFIQNTIKTMNK